MAKIGLIPLRVLRRIVELKKDEDPNTIVGIHFPIDELIVDEKEAEPFRVPGGRFWIFDGTNRK